jgi:superfamily I DNA/RNA helicase
MFTPSKYQKAVYTYILKGKGNAVVDAVAGSGKSTTIVNALKIIPSDKRVLFLAFNKSIVDELKHKIGNMPNVEISTLHSLGARAIMRTVNTKINGSKYMQYLNQGIKEGRITPTVQLSNCEKVNWKNSIIKLLDLARVNLVDDVRAIVDLSIKHDVDIVDNEPDIVRNLITWGKNNVSEIDFTDMIYFPNVLNIRMNKYDWVFIDECQDLNAAQRNMFLKCINTEGGRFVAVGDEKQAIYGFSGADAESFHKLRHLPHTVKLPLSICYRCDKSIINLAQSIVPQIQSRADAADGIIDRAAKIDDVHNGDMILCRVTSPLIELCMRYISRGVKAYVKGRDVGTNLCNLLQNTKQVKINNAIEVLYRDLSRRIGKLIAQGLATNEEEAKRHPRYIADKDKIESIEVISEGLDTVAAVVEKIQSIFSDDSDGICLSTVHKSKGLENNRVFIIKPEKLPLLGCMNIPWMAEQEMNLVYVAYTRAKHYLGFIGDF